MGDIIVPQNYVSFAYANDFRKLCQPLFLNTNIDLFRYVRLYKDGGYFNFSTAPEVDKFLLFECKGKLCSDVKYLDATFHDKYSAKIKENRINVFTEDIDIGGYWAPYFKEFNIKSSFSIMEKFDDYYEKFEFVTRFNKNIYTFYINHYDILEKFILYFRERGTNLINIGEKNKFIWLNSNPTYCKIVQNLARIIPKKEENIARLKDSFKLKKYIIGNDNSKACITSRELECLQYLGRGFSYKEIGNILQLSARTIETHVQHIKDKLGMHSHSQLLKTYHSSTVATLDL